MIASPSTNPSPTLSESARPIVINTSGILKRAAKAHFARSATISNSVAISARVNEVTGNVSSLHIGHDSGTDLVFNTGVLESVATKLNFTVTKDGLSLVALHGWTGRIAVPVLALQSGALVQLYIGVVEVPGEVITPRVFMKDLSSLVVTWKPDSSQVVLYNIYDGSKLICSTPWTVCSPNDAISTHAKLTIEAIGHQDTHSALTPPVYSNSKLVAAEVVHFDTNSATLRTYDKALLNNFVRSVKIIGINLIFIAGHTDATGPASLNAKLGVARAQAVRDYLVKAFKDVVFEIKGYGSAAPTSDNTSSSGRENNRRAEIWVG